jgi:hypothetical protein
MIVNDTFEGKFKNGHATGQGIIKFASGDQYSGSFKKSMKNGKGKYVSVSNVGHQYRFSGEFASNSIEGEGFI